MESAHDRRLQLPNPEERRQPRWPLRVALSFVILMDAFLVVMLTAERNVGNIPTLVSSIGLVVFSTLAWRGIRCSSRFPSWEPS